MSLCAIFEIMLLVLALAFVAVVLAAKWVLRGFGVLDHDGYD